MKTRLAVSLGATRVGTLRLAGDRTSFGFEDSYLDLPGRPVLSRSYEDELTRGYVDGASQSRLPPFFRNLLPEEGALRTLLARRAGVPEHRDFPLLAVLGEDLAGAVVVREEGDDEERDDEQISGVADGGQADARTGLGGALRFSLAGLQLKFSVVRTQDSLTLPVTGQGGRWILKLPDARHDRVPVCEYSVMRWAARARISVPEVELVDPSVVQGLPDEIKVQEVQALLVRRFDRTDAGRVQQDDFAQVLRKTEKYEGASYATLANIVYRVCGEDDFEQFVRRLVFMVLSGNADMHLKNIALVYPDGRRARLSPAYDLVCTMAYPGTSTELALRLGKEVDPHRLRAENFARLCPKDGPEPKRVGEVVAEAAGEIRRAFAEISEELPWSDEVKSFLRTHLERVRFP